MKSWFVLFTLIAAPAVAQDFGARYPAGSIPDGVEAQVVLKEADAEMTRIAQHAKARDAECLRGFFVSSCREDVRREKELAEREVRRVRVEARDVQRRIEAERVAKRRSDDEAARAAEDAQRPQKESKAGDAAKAREAAAKQREAVAPKEGAPGQTNEQDRSHQTQSRMTAEERAENARKFQQKQEQAQKHAQAQEAKRNENEQRRAERRKRIEEQEAAREEIRKKAAESIK